MKYFIYATVTLFFGCELLEKEEAGCGGNSLPGGRNVDVLAIPDIDVGIESKAAGPIRYFWDRDELLVSFLELPDERFARLIEETAKEWTLEGGGSGNIRFRFGNFERPDIRIAFKESGHWSYIGTAAEYVPLDNATMNLQFKEYPSRQKVAAHKAVILHEFGHALGLIHEHKHPESGIEWCRDEVIKFYSGHPNYWDIRRIENNILNHYSNVSMLRYSDYDPDSIMHYPILPAFTRDGRSVPWNSGLSEYDLQFVGSIYN